ncbi:MAG: DUF2079 domain-containing protein, partial [Planctomycetaceae bacterium]
YASLFVPLLLGGCAALGLAAVLAVVRRGVVLRDVVGGWAFRGWLWWLLPGGWEALHVAADLTGANLLSGVLVVTLPFWLAVALAGWLSVLLNLLVFPPCSAADRVSDHNLPANGRSRRGLLIVAGMCAVFVGTFVWMNWQMYFALNVPHGDSAMYEEHLWNLTHGKGFRSYLDDGRLFLGEHVQVAHLLLVPLHLVWPSQLLLELCESLALAGGAIPVYWIARRHGGSTSSAVLLAAAFLLYTPLHYLDISIDGKTFRPTSFGVPALLFALDQLERRRYRTMFALLLLALSAKEDYAVVVSCLGLWMALRPGGNREEAPVRRRLWGVGLAVFGAAYLLLVIAFVIPAFRGDAPHYARYFGELGNTPADVARSVFTKTGVILGKLFSVRSALYAVLLLLPVGFLPLRSPGRLAVALPWFGVLCLLELTGDPAKQGTELLVPWHHFHATIIPILFWAGAAGLGARETMCARLLRRMRPNAGRPRTTTWASFALSGALFTSVIHSFHPLSLHFYDAGSPLNHKTRYHSGKRADAARSVLRLVPKSARVFSTDFIHTRFTHYRRSYDYSGYKRKSDEERTHPIPGEDYYIVIDAQSRYSTMEKPEDVPEFHRPEWELVHHKAEEYFIILHRRR